MPKPAGAIMTRPNSGEGQLTPQTAAEVAAIAVKAAQAIKEGKQPAFNTTELMRAAIQNAGKRVHPKSGLENN